MEPLAGNQVTSIRPSCLSGLRFVLLVLIWQGFLWTSDKPTCELRIGLLKYFEVGDEIDNGHKQRAAHQSWMHNDAA